MIGYSLGHNVGDTREEFICPKCKKQWWAAENGRFCRTCANDSMVSPTVLRVLVLVKEPNPDPRSWWMIGYDPFIYRWEDINSK